MKKSFILYTDTYQAIKSLSKNDKANLLDAIFLYSIEQRVIKLSPTAEVAFNFIKNTLLRDAKKWEEIRRVRSIAGKKGGLSRVKNEQAKLNLLRSKSSKIKQDQANQAVSVSVSVNDSVTVNDSVSDNVYINTKTLLRDKSLSKGASSQFGNLEVNLIIDHLKEKMELPELDLSERVNRQYAWNLLKKSKTGPAGVKWLIDLAASDPWFRNHISSMRDLWNNQVKIVQSKRGEVNKYVDITSDEWKRTHGIKG